ncbi:MAG: Hpt domain-containing protein [Nitrospira sp.]|nr:Hpt domain-containing protein [Nitrospira sp.]
MNQPSPDQPVAHPDLPIVHVEQDFEPLLPKFMTNRKKEVVTMREALGRQDFDTVRKVAHGMKGAGGSYGFDLVTAMAATIEQAAKTATAPTIATELELLGTYLDRVQVVFDE